MKSNDYAHDFIYETGGCNFGIGTLISGIYHDRLISVRSSSNTWFDIIHTFTFKRNEFILVCRIGSNDDGTPVNLVTASTYYAIARMVRDKDLCKLKINRNDIDLFTKDDSFGGPITYTREELELLRKKRIHEKIKLNIPMETYTQFAKATQYMVEHGEYQHTKFIDRNTASKYVLEKLCSKKLHV